MKWSKLESLRKEAVFINLESKNPTDVTNLNIDELQSDFDPRELQRLENDDFQFLQLFN